MSVFILTKKEQLNVCVELAGYMERTSSEVTIFTEPGQFYASIDTAPPGDIEYVMIDVRTFQMDLFNPYTYIARCNNPVPVVVFNDPYPDPDSRAAYWYVKNKSYLLPYVGERKLELLIPAFALLESYFHKHEFSNYLCGICPPQKLLSATEKKQKEALDRFAVNHKLPKSRKLLFEYFLMNKGKELTEEEICAALWDDCSHSSKQTLYTYISELRKACRAEESVKIDILRKGKGTYQMDVTSSGC